MFKRYKSKDGVYEAVQFNNGNKYVVLTMILSAAAGGSYPDFENDVPVIRIAMPDNEIGTARFGDWIIKTATPGVYCVEDDKTFQGELK